MLLLAIAALAGGAEVIGFVVAAVFPAINVVNVDLSGTGVA